MKAILPLAVLALSLLMFSSAESPVVASSAFPASMDGQGNQAIKLIRRNLSESSEVISGIRDPFSSQPVVTPQSEQPPVLTAAVHSARAASLPAFRILGKQEDEAGWAVFIGAPDTSGQVWVVREGETFNDGFRVSKLAPPLLVIKSLRSQQSKTFNIGKDEE